MDFLRHFRRHRRPTKRRLSAMTSPMKTSIHRFSMFRLRQDPVVLVVNRHRTSFVFLRQNDLKRKKIQREEK